MKAMELRIQTSMALTSDVFGRLLTTAPNWNVSANNELTPTVVLDGICSAPNVNETHEMNTEM